MAGALKVRVDATTWAIVGGQGPKGDTGDTGPTGSTGSQGTPGEKWFSQAGAPAGATGIVGDWALDTTSGDVYEKTGASTWTSRGNLRGPQGVTGSTGSQGPPGDWTTPQTVPTPTTSTAIAPAVADVGKLFLLDATGIITVTLPSDATAAITVGCRLDYIRYNTGTVSFTNGSGATVNPSGATIRARYSAATAIKVAANSWVIVGDLA